MSPETIATIRQLVEALIAEGDAMTSVLELVERHAPQRLVCPEFDEMEQAQLRVSAVAEVMSRVVG